MLTSLSENDPKIEHGLYAGLYRWWNCLEKAQIAHKHFKRGIIVVGELTIFNKNYDSSYQFLFNPPYEFHAWVQENELIYDYGLYGAIEHGCQLCDEQGPYLDREPIFLDFEKPYDWTVYNAKAYIDASYASNS